ncbi:MAG: 4Fe-4S binding protein, partial [Candidatus Thermoplasmatota archaeon]|nr:4Fe-4S binding protein [Candidatus Thermoplasmatota archaeon]
MIKVKFLADKCLACKTCELQCAIAHTSMAAHINEAIWIVPQPFPRLKITTENGKPKILRCMQCKKPKCVEVCESGALRQENGVVILNEEKCTGCWNCIEACPFKSIFKNELLNIAIKCDLCNNKEKLACVASCPTGALS